MIGVDANADGMRYASRRAARGGVTNALFGRLSLEDAPGELAGIADAVTVLLPWGGLLRAVALPDPSALSRLRALCKPNAELRVVFGHGAVDALGLPLLDDPALAAQYRDAGFAVKVRPVPLDEIRALPTTWAKKLAFSGRERRFVEIVSSAGSIVGRDERIVGEPDRGRA